MSKKVSNTHISLPNSRRSFFSWRDVVVVIQFSNGLSHAWEILAICPIFYHVCIQIILDSYNWLCLCWCLIMKHAYIKIFPLASHLKILPPLLKIVIPIHFDWWKYQHLKGTWYAVRVLPSTTYQQFVCYILKGELVNFSFYF